MLFVFFSEKPVTKVTCRLIRTFFLHGTSKKNKKKKKKKKISVFKSFCFLLSAYGDTILWEEKVASTSKFSVINLIWRISCTIINAT